MNLIKSNTKDLEYIGSQNNNLLNYLEILKNIVPIENKGDIQNEINKLIRINEDMKKGLYFLTIQGSLKTGKSTLTNLLIGKEVAVTQAGVDTTKTPYVITKSNNDIPAIFVYKLIKSPKKPQDIENIIESIVDDVKGIKLQNNKWNSYFRKEKLKFTTENIKKYTVNESYNEALFINIQIPRPKEAKEWILDYEIALLDTPGIEGKKATQSQNVIKEIKRRTNMLIVMQSTVTPINNEEIKALKEYKNEGAELRHMHNKFELKPWANEYDRKKFLESEKKAIERGKDILKNEFGLKEVITESFNLAKVEDYLRNNQDYKFLKNEYDEFINFVKGLITSIETIKFESKREKALKQVLNLFNNWESEDGIFFKLKSKFEKDLEDIETELNEIKKAFLEYEKNIREFREDFFNKNYSKINEYINYKLMKEANTHLEIPNNLINKAEKEIIDNIEMFISNLNNELNELLKEYILKLLNEEKKVLDRQLNEIKSFLKEKKFTKFIDKLYPINFNITDIPNIINISVTKEEIKGLLNNKEFIKKESKGGLIGKILPSDKYLQTEKFEKHLKDNIFQKAMINGFSNFIQDFKTDIFNNANGVLDNYLKQTNKILLEVEEEYNKNVLNRKERNKNSIVSIEELFRNVQEVKRKLV